MKTNKLKGKIIESGYSQRSLAEEIGISANTLNSKVNGKVPFTTNEAAIICEKLGIVDDSERVSIFLTSSSQ